MTKPGDALPHAIVISDELHVEFSGSVPCVGDTVSVHGTPTGKPRDYLVKAVKWFTSPRGFAPGGTMLPPPPSLEARVIVEALLAAEGED